MIAISPQEFVAKIRVIRKIKDSGNSSIYEAYDESLPGPSLQPNCAIKERSKREDNQPLSISKREQQWKETDIHFEVNDCPHIATLFKVIDCEASSLMIMEYFPEGDLMKAIKEGENWGVDGWVKRIFLQIIGAVEFCHKKGVFHRDLKTENILVYGDRAALTDFGSATREYASDTGHGTISIMSPECLAAWASPGKLPPYTLAPSDIWSLGIILVNMITKRVPWSIASIADEEYKEYRDGVPLNSDSLLPLSDEIQAILNMIFEEDPEKRPEISGLLELVDGCSRFGSEERQKKVSGV
ncbi:kinase-like protein [Acephala macrosclerotiorum]|nr:kinase-like protein [Acephala macrosclerotiorum]